MTTMPFFLAASKSMFPKPTAKFEIILISSGSLFIVSASNFSVKDDKIKYKNHIIPGIENAGSAIKKLFSGENEGKLIIKISEPN